VKNISLINPATIALVALLAIVLVVVSPFVMGALDNGKTDWDRLSSIGQSYGAISALLSAAALIGVAATLGLGARQLRDGRRATVRHFHLELLKMALEDRRFVDVWGSKGTSPNLDDDVVVYCNLVFNYLLCCMTRAKALTKKSRCTFAGSSRAI
jgi:hypothetical protein